MRDIQHTITSLLADCDQADAAFERQLVEVETDIGHVAVLLALSDGVQRLYADGNAIAGNFLGNCLGRYIEKNRAHLTPG